MPGENPGFNPNKRLPIGYKIPDTPEAQMAIAKLDREVKESEAKRQQQVELGNVHIRTPEQTKQMLAEVERIKALREKIQGMN